MLRGTFVFGMQQDQRQHLRKVFWNGAEYVLQALTVQQEPPVKYHAQWAHTGKDLLACSHRP